MLTFFLISILWIAGCKSDSTVFDGKVSSYNDLAEKIDHYMADVHMGDLTHHPFAIAFEQLDPEEKSEMALHMAEQIAVAAMFDLATDEVMSLAGQAVKAYPHPLLLNNFAAILQDRGRLEEALEMALLALQQQPEHPILLTNAANLYIELDDFAAAELHATKALQAGGDFGPAYQVMTTVHLRNNNSELAAETMVKSAKHVFNDVSIHHFESFLDEVARLDPREDEYPLNQAFIDELFEIANSNVDTANVNEGIDTPAGQIQLKPFPSFGSPEHLISSWGYLEKEMDKLHEAMLQASEEQFVSHDEEDESQALHEHSISFEFNLRQIYAYGVLESYYKFKVDQWLAQYDELFVQLEEDRLKKYEGFFETYDAQMEALYEKERAWIPVAHSEFMKVEVDYRSKRFDALKQDANELLSKSQDIHKKKSQLVEEFWLKSGGLLKYIVDPDTFHHLNGKRKHFVYESVVEQLYDLRDLSFTLSAEFHDLNMAKYFLNPENQKEESTEEEETGPEFKPDIEGRELDEFPEPGTIYNIQIGLDHGFFGNDASISGNKTSYEASIDTMFGAKGWDGNFQTNIHRSYTLYDVKAVGDTKWFTDTKMVQKLLEEGYGAWAKQLGKHIGIGLIFNDREGKYNVRKGASKRIMDRGKIHVQESGWSLGAIEKVSKTENTVSSLMIGLSSHKKSVKYKFLFFTMSYDQR